jgi:hypothetical protein
MDSVLTAGFKTGPRHKNIRHKMFIGRSGRPMNNADVMVTSRYQPL